MIWLDENGHYQLTEKQKKILEFFQSTISPEQMAQLTRRTNYLIGLTAIRNADPNVKKEWLDDGYYWLNELAEVLDPVLDK